MTEALKINGTDTSTNADLVIGSPTSVETANIQVAGDIEGLEARTQLVRDQFDANMVEERHAADSAEERNATLMALGYGNALDWLANKDALYKALAKIGLKPAPDEAGLLSQIAKLQIGRPVENKAGASVWSVPSRRDERLGRFYRIFFGQPEKFPRDSLREVILAYPKRSGGILSDAKPDKVTVTREEKAFNRKLAKKAQPVARLNKPSIMPGKLGSYRLALVRVEPHGLDICQFIEGEDALTERLTDKWAAEAALTVSSDEE